MSDQQIHNEILLIKKMIEKTQKDTAQSGHLFIFIGLLSLIGTLTIGILENLNQVQWVMPTVIFMAAGNAAIGYLIGKKEIKENTVKTYAKTIFWHIWMVCGFTALLVTFFFPLVHLYPVQAVPVLVAVIMGIALFLTGTVLELKYLKWSSLAWLGGACAMALSAASWKFFIMALFNY